VFVLINYNLSAGVVYWPNYFYTFVLLMTIMRVMKMMTRRRRRRMMMINSTGL